MPDSNLRSFESLSFLSISHVHDHVLYNLTRDEIGIIIKSGYSTRDRLTALVNAMENDWKASNIMVAADYSLPQGEHLNLKGDIVTVKDVIAPLCEEQTYREFPRMQAYLDSRAAIEKGETEGQNKNGWELDILKHITGLEEGFRHLSDEKWYIMIDDDTFLLPTSLEGLLSTLDPDIPYYLGSAIGEKARFAHGGSGIVLSYKSMEKLFLDHPHRLAAAKKESFTALWGDALVSDTLRKIGIRISEEHSSHFNGEKYTSTRLRPDLFCTIFVGFHHVGASDMAEVKSVFQNFTRPVRYGDLLPLIAGSITFSAEREATKENWDFIAANPRDESVQVHHESLSWEHCAGLCQKTLACLAWTYDDTSKTCRTADWITVGHAEEGNHSGINVGRASTLLRACE